MQAVDVWCVMVGAERSSDDDDAVAPGGGDCEPHPVDMATLGEERFEKEMW